MRGIVWVMDLVLWGCGLELLPSVQVSNVYYPYGSSVTKILQKIMLIQQQLFSETWNHR